MGFFSSDSSDSDYSEESIRELVENAESDTVTTERLTSTNTGGIISNGINLGNNPIQYFLRDDEQPHFIFYRNYHPILKFPENKTDIYKKIKDDSNLAICLTDNRILIINSTRGRDLVKSIPYSAISEVRDIRDMGHYLEISIQVKPERTEIIKRICNSFGKINVSNIESKRELGICISSGFEQKLIEDAKEYLSSKIAQESYDTQNAESTTQKPTKIDKSKLSDSSAGGTTPLSVEVGISIHSNSDISGGLGRIGTGFVTRKNKQRTPKTFGNDQVNLTYEYASKRTIRLRDSGLAFRGKNIDYSDILNVRMLTGRDLIADSNSSFVLHKCDYIVLTIANGGVPPDETPATYEGDVFYMYLIGSPEKLAYYGTVYRDDDTNYDFEISNVPSASKSDLRNLNTHISEQVNDPAQDVYILQDYIERPSHLQIEGWQESGATDINAGIDGSTKNRGKSRGVQIGPYTSSRSKSKGSITAELDGSIADSSFSSEIKFLHISENGIFVDSDPVLDFDYGEIDRILRRDSGFTIEVGETAYTVVGPKQLASMTLGKDESFSELDSPATEDAIRFAQQQIQKKSSQQDQDGHSNGEDSISDKLRELKKLKDDGIVTDEEFRSKKEELLDDF